MAAPTFEVVQKSYQNPHASIPLLIPIQVFCNTSDDVLNENVRVNSAKDLKWVKAEKVHNKIAIMVGGGPSVADCLDKIKELQQAGGVVFAMNAVSQWLRERGVVPDYQVMSDAKPETSALVDPEAKAHLFASQVNPKTMDAVPNPTVWHLETGSIEENFPERKVRRGGYALIGGGVATGICALCVVYTLGFRDLHVFGYDSSHREGNAHAYYQAMNVLIPTVDVEWAGRTFTSSVAMKAQAEKFQITSQALKQKGCTLTVYGDGLLQHMYSTPPTNLTERDKYRTLWQFDRYREVSPGEFYADQVASMFERPGPVIDFGCGTGRASLRLVDAGYTVMLVDFADNCRDDEALRLPFLEWDLTRPCPLRAPYGICCDVMEHIPPGDVDTVIRNIMASARKVFFHISTIPDLMGEFISSTLHLTVRNHLWWEQAFRDGAYKILASARGEISSTFMVANDRH